MHLEKLLTRIVVALALIVCAPAAMAAPSQPVATQHSERDSTRAAVPAQVAPSDDATRYAAMEKQDPKAANFRGGDTIVIAMSTTAAIVAVVLLILLI